MNMRSPIILSCTGQTEQRDCSQSDGAFPSARHTIVVYSVAGFGSTISTVYQATADAVQ